MIDVLIRYGKYAPLLTGILLLWSAIHPPKKEDKWRYILGGMGIVLLYSSIHMLLKTK